MGRGFDSGLCQISFESARLCSPGVGFGVAATLPHLRCQFTSDVLSTSPSSIYSSSNQVEENGCISHQGQGIDEYHDIFPSARGTACSEDIEYLFTMVGNLNYTAPEVLLDEGYDEQVDWWAIGVLTFNLLSSISPFEDASGLHSVIFENILLNNINWNAFPKEVSSQCLSFINDLLESDPYKRLGGHRSASENRALNHAFFRDLDLQSLHSRPGPYIPLVNNLLPYSENLYHVGSLDFNQSGHRNGLENASEEDDQSFFSDFSYAYTN